MTRTGRLQRGIIIIFCGSMLAACGAPSDSGSSDYEPDALDLFMRVRPGSSQSEVFKLRPNLVNAEADFLPKSEQSQKILQSKLLSNEGTFGRGLTLNEYYKFGGYFKGLIVAEMTLVGHDTDYVASMFEEALARARGFVDPTDGFNRTDDYKNWTTELRLYRPPMGNASRAYPEIVFKKAGTTYVFRYIFSSPTNKPDDQFAYVQVLLYANADWSILETLTPPSGYSLCSVIDVFKEFRLTDLYEKNATDWHAKVIPAPL